MAVSQCPVIFRHRLRKEKSLANFLNRAQDGSLPPDVALAVRVTLV